MSLEAATIRIRRTGARERRPENLPRGAHDAPVQTAHGNPVAGFCDRVLRLDEELRVLLEYRIDLRARLNIRPMVDELFDGDARRELGQTADMITVVMGGDQVIDLRDSSVLDRGHDAISVTDGGGASVSSIDEDRLA